MLAERYGECIRCFTRAPMYNTPRLLVTRKTEIQQKRRSKSGKRIRCFNRTPQIAPTSDRGSNLSFNYLPTHQ